MSGNLRRRLTFLVLPVALLFISVSVVQAQESSPAASSSQPQAQQPQQPENPNAAIGKELSAASHDAEKSEEHEENAQFKYSPTVQWVAKHLGTNPHAAYFISLFVNFGLLALFFWALLRSKVPAMFRDRTALIQKGIKDAQVASADAAARLGSIESRLSKLDTEIASLRSEAEKQAIAEEQRIKAAAEEDKHKVVDSAAAEIDAIARNARRDLKSYAASLAIDIAAKRIQVDARADQALVREFVDQLGKDGR
jgi:F-type H+-transporting ATPase subunit b